MYSNQKIMEEPPIVNQPGNDFEVHVVTNPDFQSIPGLEVLENMHEITVKQRFPECLERKYSSSKLKSTILNNFICFSPELF